MTSPADGTVPFRSERVPSPGRDPDMLVVAGEATYRKALELRRSLMAAILECSSEVLMVDLGAVGRLDTACMAVLVEGLMVGRDRGTDVLLCGPSPAVRDIFALAGLDEALGKCVSCREEALERMRGRS